MNRTRPKITKALPANTAAKPRCHAIVEQHPVGDSCGPDEMPRMLLTLVVRDTHLLGDCRVCKWQLVNSRMGQLTEAQAFQRSISLPKNRSVNMIGRAVVCMMPSPIVASTSACIDQHLKPHRIRQANRTMRTEAVIRDARTMYAGRPSDKNEYNLDRSWCSTNQLPRLIGVSPCTASLTALAH